MSVMTCAVCGGGFSARSDAVYCSAACRQKAHRARTADTAGRRGDRHDTASLQGACAASLQRAREQVERSRELCRWAERGMQRTAEIRHEVAATRAAGGSPAFTASGLPWPGN